jgi:hypothetical protein
MIWYKKLGFHNNPFSIKPAAFQRDMVAYDLEYIFEKIDNAEMIFLEGEYGTGKTTILKNIINYFRGKHKIIYYSFNSGKEFDLKNLVHGANSLLRRVTGIKERDMILLLDEVESMTKKQADSVLKYYQSGILQTVVFVNPDYEKINLPEDLKLYLGDNVICTVELNLDEATELITERIGDIDLFPSKIIKQIFDLSKKNPRRFLEYCEDVARYAVDMSDYKVEEYHVETVLEDVIANSKQKKVATPKKKVVEQKKKVIEQKKLKVSESEPVDLEAVDVKEEPEQKTRSKKFKVNKLLDGKKDPLGAIEANDDEPKIEIKELNTDEKIEVQDVEETKSVENDEEVPEYKVFVFDD